VSEILKGKTVKIRELASLIGRLSSSTIAILPAPLQYRSLQRKQILELASGKASHQCFGTESNSDCISNLLKLFFPGIKAIHIQTDYMLLVALTCLVKMGGGGQY